MQITRLTDSEPEPREPADDDAKRRTQETLGARPSRAEDYKSETEALFALARQLADYPSRVQQRLVELVVDLCRAGSAGISLPERDETGAEVFRWTAVAGAFSHYLGGTMPFYASPCGVVIDLDCCLFYEDVAERFPAAATLQPAVVEIILAPFHVNGHAVGTIWALSHDPHQRFDAEDMRLLASIADFASLRIFAPQAVLFAPSVRDEAARALTSLTKRQKEILERILWGQTNKVIAADLGISTRTAESHRAAIMKKMQASSVSGLVQRALSGAEAGGKLGEAERSFASVKAR